MVWSEAKTVCRGGCQCRHFMGQSADGEDAVATTCRLFIARSADGEDAVATTCATRVINAPKNCCGIVLMPSRMQAVPRRIRGAALPRGGTWLACRLASRDAASPA